MKYIKLLTLIIIFGCAKSSTKYLQVADINSSKERLEFAKQISHRILDAQKNNSFYELSSKEATSKMVEGLNEERQRKSYESISGKFGIYQGLEFNQLVKPKDGTLYETYRFKGKFSSNVDVEIRTTIDGNCKLAGIYVMKWRDKM